MSSPILQIDQQIISNNRPLRIFLHNVDPQTAQITVNLIDKNPSITYPEILIRPNQLSINSTVYPLPGLLQANQVWILQTNTDGTFQLVRYDATNPNNLVELNRWSFPIQLNPLQSFFAPISPEIRRLLSVRSDQLSRIELTTTGIYYQVY